MVLQHAIIQFFEKINRTNVMPLKAKENLAKGETNALNKLAHLYATKQWRIAICELSSECADGAAALGKFIH